MSLEKEITVKILTPKEQVHKTLKEKGWSVVIDRIGNDIYMAPKDINLDEESQVVLNKCFLLRLDGDGKALLTYKKKHYNQKRELVCVQSMLKCEEDQEKAKEFFEAIGFKALFRIVSHFYIYQKEGRELIVQEIKDQGLYIEVEQKTQAKHQDVKELLAMVRSLGFNIDESNYYWQKAVVALNNVRFNQ